MLFQHYTVDDFQNHHILLSKKITTDNLITLLNTVSNELIVIPSTVDGVNHDSININSESHMLIHGKSFNRQNRNRKYNSLKDWLTNDGFPVVVNLVELREMYPTLTVVSDLQLAMLAYAAEYPHDEVNSAYCFNNIEGDIMDAFVLGFNEYAVPMEFDGHIVATSKLRYLIKQGQHLRIGECA